MAVTGSLNARALSSGRFSSSKASPSSSRIAGSSAGNGRSGRTAVMASAAAGSPSWSWARANPGWAFTAG